VRVLLQAQQSEHERIAPNLERHRFAQTPDADACIASVTIEQRAAPLLRLQAAGRLQARMRVEAARAGVQPVLGNRPCAVNST